MSYRLIDANAIASQCPEVNGMPCIYVDLDKGLDECHYDLRGANALQAENVKLRELVLDYDKVLDAAVDVWGIMADALGYGRKYDSLHERARELGIEVDR